LSITALATGLLGCSIYPLPEDVSRKNTYDIVEKIRCEAAEGLREALPQAPPNHPILVNTYIGYDFDFDIIENNNLGTGGGRGNLKFERKHLSPDGSFTLEVTPFAERQRKTNRNFRIIESLKQLREARCSEAETQNWIYPITGAIGLNEIVNTYVRLEQLTNFGKLTSGTTTTPTPPTPTVPAGADTPIVFSDVLTYTTKLGGGVKPELTLNSVVGSLKLTKASIFADATRDDTHQVTVALARDLKIPVDVRLATRSGRAARVQTLETEYVDRVFRAQVYNARISRGADAVAQKDLPPETRVLLELERRRSLGEDERLATRLVDILRPPPAP
jgi:hypothetical protein